MTGFRGRSGRSFNAKLELVQNEEGKWRVEFDEEWARQPRPTPPDEETIPAADAADANGADPAPARRRRPVAAE